MDNDTITIKVFKDSPEWNNHSKWWMLPIHRLNALFLGKWECDGEPTQEQKDYIAAQYNEPVVLVY